MRVLLLNPPYGEDFCRSARWAAKSRGRVQRHPDWFLIAAAILEKAGNEVRFTDGATLNLNEESIKKIIAEYNPAFVVCHTTTPSIYNDIHFTGTAKKICNPVTALIGPHVSVMPENTFEIAKGSVDIIVRGEYDYALRDIAGGKSWKDIAGISYHKDGNIFNNPQEAPIDVNELPFPAWHHIKPEWYKDAGKLFPFLTLLSGRGCFANCTFCRDTPIMYGRKLRYRRPELVVDEIEYDYKLFPYIKEIMFETDTFTASSSHVRGVCEEILKRSLKIKWSCNVRVDVDLELLPLMKRAGCRMLMIGFEFGTQQSLDAVKKGITLEQSMKFAGAAHKLGFTLHGCFMIGAPGETRESAQKTIDFAKKLPLDTVQFSGICVYPGTELYDWAKSKDYIVPKDWNEWVNNSKEQVTLLNYPQLSKNEIDEYVDKGLRQFYLRPKQMFKMFFAIKSFGDLRRKLYGLKGFLNYFKSKK
ncbi:MAG: radical SAM protein [Bacteroidota bacterium]